MIELEAKRRLPLAENERDYTHHVATCQSIDLFLQTIELTLGLFRHRREKRIHVITDRIRCNEFRFNLEKNNGMKSSHRHACQMSTNAWLGCFPNPILE